MTFQIPNASKRRVAIFVDGDNISHSYADVVLNQIQTEGTAGILRVYGNAAKSSPWLKQLKFQFIHAGTGKNAADLLLCIEAIELAAQGVFDTAIIASSDGDFRHLAFALRARGIRVVGLGEYKTPDAFTAACTDFHVVEPVKSDMPDEVAAHRPDDLTVKNIRAIIAKFSKGGRGISLKALNDEMRKELHVTLSAVNAKTWRSYLRKFPDDFVIDPSDPDDPLRTVPMVRFLKKDGL